MFRLLVFLAALCGALGAFAQTEHQRWDALLRAHVSPSGAVDYAALSKNKASVDAYLLDLQKNPPAADWSDARQMAFWINAYNAFTIQLILEKYPKIKSIMELDNGQVWKTRRLRIGAEAYTLDQIEKEQLLQRFREPRIHFAVNCAAASCPPLLPRAWTAENLEAMLEQQTRAFINDPKYQKINVFGAEVSKIFEWYAADFGDVRAFLNRYLRQPILPTAALTYREYDWRLNKK